MLCRSRKADMPRNPRLTATGEIFANPTREDAVPRIIKLDQLQPDTLRPGSIGKHTFEGLTHATPAKVTASGSVRLRKLR